MKSGREIRDCYLKNRNISNRLRDYGITMQFAQYLLNNLAFDVSYYLQVSFDVSKDRLEYY